MLTKVHLQAGKTHLKNPLRQCQMSTSTQLRLRLKLALFPSDPATYLPTRLPRKVVSKSS